jgi:hypothetical protein
MINEGAAQTVDTGSSKSDESSSTNPNTNAITEEF